MLPNNSVLTYIFLSEKYEIYTAEDDENLHNRLDLFKIIFRCSFLSSLVEDTWTGFFFSSPSDSLSLPANWYRELSTAALIVLFITLLSVFLLLFDYQVGGMEYSLLYYRSFSYCLIFLGRVY